MSIWKSALLCLSMFSKLPVPQVPWEEKNMRYLLAFLPLVGVIIGACLWGWLWTSERLSFGPVLRAGGCVLLPILISGGIHLDGFCDTCDALASHAQPEKKRAIMKDPHTGAFAVIAVGVYLVALLSICTEIAPRGRERAVFCLIPVWSRVLGALASGVFPARAGEGLLITFRTADKNRAAVIPLWVLGALCMGGLLWLSPIQGGAVLLAGMGSFAYVYGIAVNEFQGMSGDLAGFGISLSELMMAVLFFMGKKIGG